MEDIGSPRREAITYAVLTLLVELITVQCVVFDLWYSRRCYERSRGEMITMIFEKTLARKIIGAPKKSESDAGEDEAANGNANNTSNQAKHSRFHPQALRQKVQYALQWFFTSKAEKKEGKEPASMGKILNLMRYLSRGLVLPSRC